LIQVEVFMEILGVLLGVAAIVFLSLKGLSIIVAAPVAALIVAAFNGMGIFESFLGNGSHQFMGALGNYIINFFPIFLLGAVLAKLMEASGATVSIADFILEKFGRDQPYRVLVALFAICLLLTYGGVSIFVVIFAIVPLARKLFSELDIDWALFPIPLWLGISTITLVVLPGAPAIQNVMPTQFLGTNLMALALPSLVAALACFIFSLVYMKRALDQSFAAGDYYYEKDDEPVVSKEGLPPVGLSIAPLLLFIALILGGSLFGNEFVQRHIILMALVASIAACLLLFYKYLPDLYGTLSAGAANAIVPVFSVAVTVGFGAVVVNAPGFSVFANWILGIPGTPMFSLAVLNGVLAMVTGTVSGTLGIVLPEFSQYFLDAGLHPELIHRISAISATMLVNMPQSGVVITVLALCKMDYKANFKYTFVPLAASLGIALMVVMILGSALY